MEEPLLTGLVPLDDMIPDLQTTASSTNSIADAMMDSPLDDISTVIDSIKEAAQNGDQEVY